MRDVSGQHHQTAPAKPIRLDAGAILDLPAIVTKTRLDKGFLYTSNSAYVFTVLLTYILVCLCTSGPAQEDRFGD
jgi:hypothetical protein